MSAKGWLGSRQIWAVVAWFALVALVLAAIALDDVSIAIGAGVAAVWALCRGFFPAAAVDR